MDDFKGVVVVDGKMYTAEDIKKALGKINRVEVWIGQAFDGKTNMSELVLIMGEE